MKVRPKIQPHLWFDKEAREAAEFYATVFPDSRVVRTVTLTGTPSGDVEIVLFELCGQAFQALSAGPLFKFNEAISFVVECETQAEIDYYWGALSADPKAEACGWLKDRYGLSWQIVPVGIEEMLGSEDAAAVGRAMAAMLAMKKLDIAALDAAFAG